ncbi:hypothetical protein LOTGIDRAFT_235922 [Lottia gigantea]|uniref:Uncharacterized protein n=1 Tax=Lottia gigantea TaxID=225164 RepID=V4B8I3_LOTGI|nr:hypothetical protein LOTGIDRAFT_235922 [Lottia gigantea]ESO85049.1 hypothetical protein LOTGIDRAFT_235922 [Lottia gigantea]
MKRCRFSPKRRQVLCLLVVLVLGYCVLEICARIRRNSDFSQLQEYELDQLPSLNENECWIINTACSKHNYNTTKVQNIVWNIYNLNTDNRSDGCIKKNINLQLAVIEIMKRGGKYIFLTKRDSFDEIRHILSEFDLRLFSWKMILHNSETWAEKLLYPKQPFRFQVGKSPHIQKYVDKTLLTYPEIVSNYGLPGSIPKSDITVSKYETLFGYETFWTIYPLTRNEEAWSLWTQTIFKTLHMDMSVLIGNKSKMEIKMGTSSDELDEWQPYCSKDQLFCCVLSLSKHMLQLNLISNEEFRDIFHWIYSLTESGYKISDAEVTEWSKDIDMEPKYNLVYAPPVSKNRVNDFENIFNCVENSHKCPASVEKATQQSNILLVIVFNREGYYNIVEHLEKLYRPVFNNILYCGTNIKDFQDSARSLEYPVSFIEMLDNFYVGQQGYQCIQNAIRMNYDVDGYLHLSDDVLFNVWNLANLPKDKFWFQHQVKTADLEQETVVDIWRNKSWWPWESSFGRHRLIESFKTLRKLAKSDNTLKSFLNQLTWNSGSDQGFYYQASDIFYVPKRLSQEFSYIISIFNTHGVYLEIAIPTTIYGLDRSKNVYKLQGDYLWYTDRNYAQEIFHYNNHFLHPIKLGPCVNDYKCSEFLCKDYVPCLNAVMPN